MMDILEEIDVFLSACQLTQDESNNLVFNGITGCFESKYLADWFVNQINFGWKLWQAAKAQSDKKIKLLLCDEHLQKCESPTGVFNSQYPDEELCLICLAKEAKAQAVPDGYVVVPKEPTEAMVEAGKDSSECGGWPDEIYKAMIEAQELAND